MKITYGMSKDGKVDNALKSIVDPSAILFFVAEEDMLEDAARAIADHFPDVPSVGAVGQSYGDKNTNVTGVTVISLSDGIVAAANVLEEADVMPIKYIRRLEADLETIDFVEEQTACIDFCCAGTDMKSLTTLNSLFGEKGIELAGGTSNSQTIAVNGLVYSNSCAYMLIKNLNGKIKAYKENIYRPMAGDNMRHLVTDANAAEYKVNELNGRPAGGVYKETLGISDEEATTQTFKNPFGHIVGNETYIVSIKDIDEAGNITTFRPANTLDILAIMELDDFAQVADQTVARMKEDLGSVSAVLSINCLFRYILYHDQEHFWNEYLAKMCAEFQHAGMIGVGEHYCRQFVNQSMCALAFE